MESLVAAGFGEDVIEEIISAIYPSQVSITKQCPMCGMDCRIDVDMDGYSAFLSGTPVQDAFSNLNPVEREFILSGYCLSCQEKLFGNGHSERIWEV